ncbi:VOC family protein [Litoribacter populi]|uniref:VOC family protein n=1 Tax=Litoribacter populi TaxID=2598460 RepID=UPI0011815DF6|nr:VOC family protein [Litoribacter populi]
MDIHQSKLSNCFWFDGNAEEAANFYIETFQDGKVNHITRYGKAGKEHHGQEEGSVLSVEFQIYDSHFTALNGGDVFSPNPSISFYVTYEDEEQLDGVWKTLATNGNILMPLDKYDWSQKYGWVQDRFGVSWQLSLGNMEDVKHQKIVPTFLFPHTQPGQAAPAIEYYTSIFPDSDVIGILQYPAEDQDGNAGNVMHAQFSLLGKQIMAMDSGVPQDYSFTEGISFVILCEDQAEVDHYWNSLSQDGEEQPCGWLKDKFGVSWQVIPRRMMELFKSNEQEAKERLSACMFKMKRLVMSELEEAFENG